MPWWPVDSTHSPSTYSYHAATSLASGKLSMIVDSGAWTNLMGTNLAKMLTQRAMQAGLPPEQHRMDTPLNIQGVGSGTQQCRYYLKASIAVPDAEGRARLHTLSAPMVEGSGASLPGLLGLKTMEEQKAILDTGRRLLIFPGPEPVEPQYPPGTVVIPLQKAPSGHLVMVLDDYEALASHRGGLPESQLQLMTSVNQTLAAVQPSFEEMMMAAADDSSPSAPPGLAHPDGTPGRNLSH